MAKHMQYFGQTRNPDFGSTIITLGTVAVGLMVGGVARVAIQTIPTTRMSQNWKDGLTALFGAAAAYLPSAGMGRVFGGAVGVAAIGSVINDRWDWSGKVNGKVHDLLAGWYDRMMPAQLPPANATRAQALAWNAAHPTQTINVPTAGIGAGSSSGRTASMGQANWSGRN